MKYEVLEGREVDPQAGVISDEIVRLTGFYTIRKFPDTLRLVVYENFMDGNVYRFLTNNFTLEAITIAELYRERWQIEFFFKWIKAALAHQDILRHILECGVHPSMDSRV